VKAAIFRSLNRWEPGVDATERREPTWVHSEDSLFKFS
jgi:hypothetical protein